MNNSRSSSIFKGVEGNISKGRARLATASYARAAVVLCLGALVGCTAGPEATTPDEVVPAPTGPSRIAAIAGCFGLARADEIVCRSDHRIREARDSGDSAVLGCVARRSSELRATYRNAEAAREAARSGVLADVDRARLDLAERNLERQLAAIDDCWPEPAQKADSVRVFAPDLPAAFPAAFPAALDEG